MTHHIHIFPDGPYLVTLPEKPLGMPVDGHPIMNYRFEQYEREVYSILSDPEKRVKFKSELDVTNLLMRSVMKNKSTLSPVEWLEKRRGQTFELPANVGVKIEYQLRSLFDDDCWNETDEEGYNLSMSLFNEYGRTNCLRKVAILLPEQPKEENLYDHLKAWLSEKMLNPNWTWSQITKDDGQYFAINDGKRFVAFNHDLKFGKTWFGIREDGDTRTVFNGIVETLEDAKRIWYLTDPN